MSTRLGTAASKQCGSRLHERMIETGWSPDEIEAIEGAMGEHKALDHSGVLTRMPGERSARH